MIFCRGVFRTLSTVYDGVFFAKIVTGFKPLLFLRKAPSLMFQEVLNTPLLSNNSDLIMSCNCGRI